MNHRKRGAIVNISSAGGDFPLPLLTVYAASKVSVSIADSIFAGNSKVLIWGAFI